MLDGQNCEHYEERVSGNIFLRPVTGTTLDVVGDHTHNFDHTTFVVRGSIRVTRGCFAPVEFKAGEHFLVKAEMKHRIEILEPDTLFFCIYAHRDAQGEVTQEWDGWGDAAREQNPGADAAYN